MIHIQFDAYWTIYTEVISILFLMAKWTKWRTCHAHAVIPKGMISITFNPKAVEYKQQIL